MYSLRVLGGARLDEPTGPASGPVTQRRPLALLAVLAAAGDGGCTRDQLAGLLWGDTDDPHALHELSDTLYVVRRALGADAVIGDARRLRLNPAVVESDVRAFHAGLERGDRAAAVAAYGGPLLEGFHPRVAAAFEEWLTGERRRLAARYADALEGLAKEAAAAGDHAAAVAWWEKLSAHDPYNSRVAVALAFALAAVRDRANGLQHLRAHVRLLREDMGIEPDAEVLDAERKLMVPREAPSAEPTAQAVPAQTVSEPVPPELVVTPLDARETPWWRRQAMLLATAAVVLVVAAAAVVLARGPRPARSAPAPPRTAIAVLPFENLSPEGPQAYFTAGLHDALLTQLARVAALSVRPRTSVMSYANSAKPMQEIAAELAVGTIVEGSVQVVGNRLRVNVQVIDAAKDRHVWAEQYDRTLDDVFGVQSEIVQRIVEAVGSTLTREEAGAIAAAPSANAEAYRLYLQGRERFLRPGYQRRNLEGAQQFLERALGLDARFALAHAALSQVHGYMYWFAYDPTPARLARQQEEAETALRLAPDLPQAHTAMGRLHAMRRDWRGALEEYRIASQGLPNDEELVAYVGYAHRRLGEWDEALAAFEEAARLDPRNADLFQDLGATTLELMRRYAEAVRADDRALSIAPDDHNAAIAKGWAYVRWQGQLDTLRAVLSRVPGDAELGDYGTRTAQRALLFLWERQADSLLQASTMAPAGVFDEQEAFVPGALYAAWAHQLRGDRPAERPAFGAALALVDSVVRERPDDWRLHVARGLALAGLGRRAEAVGEASWLRQSAVYRDDASEGPIVVENRAQILAQAGDADAALDEIGRLLVRPSFLSVQTLRLDPLWDPIRNDPRFQALLNRYARR